MLQLWKLKLVMLCGPCSKKVLFIGVFMVFFWFFSLKEKFSP